MSYGRQDQVLLCALPNIWALTSAVYAASLYYCYYSYYDWYSVNTAFLPNTHLINQSV